MGELDMYRQLGKTPNYSELARRYGIDRHTVSRYFNKEVFEQDLRSAKTSAFESFRELITEKASLPGMTKIAVYEYLLFRFPDVEFPKYNAFTEYCRKNNILYGTYSLQEPHPRFETPPGMQLQFDWKEDIRMVDKNGEIFDFNVFSATLSYSRLHVFIYVKTRTTDDLLFCWLTTIKRLGGIPKEWLTDNMSALIVHSGKKKVRSKRAFAFAKEAGFEVRDLYSLYPDEKIDVKAEQAALEGTDRIVLQFPMYWYSCPPLLKKWEDLVLEHGWAYGSTGTALRGKELLIAVSPGAPAGNYHHDGQNYPVTDLLRPFQATSNLIGTKYLQPFITVGATYLTGSDLDKQAQKYAACLQEESIPLLGAYE